MEPIRKKDMEAFHPCQVSPNDDLQIFDQAKTLNWLARFSPKGEITAVNTIIS